ncbi:glycosyltransferase family 39 protein [Candidatus Sodalis endolongispinus]|uniref:Glycosyltransferase family 39 protein n=1 Tax=Candidatus Sodalis endolongispinus TaxID=2812662 RepID=A0ABS5Y895_9GAMM|nr:glycosyltransferase family 39 protein [Candidatus Sodalis endolongispinus]MBT9431181.1 glycosyltransferase family 39 protein [Candidatus Sodalis endolongispinus]
MKTDRIILLGWCAGYAMLWAGVTFLLDPTVPYDAIEAVNWAMNAELGSPKNPWLVGLVMRPALGLSATWLSFYWYATHFLAVAVGMYGVWQLAWRLSGDRRLAWLALLALNLSGVINFDIISFNDNYLLVMLWPWLWVFFLRAAYERPGWWLAFALTGGLACMAKYSSFSFIFSAWMLTLWVPAIRRCYRQPMFYSTILLWLMIVAPNGWWLWQNDFAAFKWVNSQVTPGLTLHGLTSALTVFYPLAVLAAILVGLGARLGWPCAPQARAALGMMLIPLAPILIGFSLHDGGRITEWLQPYMMPATALMMACVRQPPTRPLAGALKKLSLCAPLVLGGYSAVMLLNVRGAGEKLAGIKPFSQEVSARWQQQYHQPVRFVGGDYLSQWLTFYIDDRPEVITPWSVSQRPNIYSRTVRVEKLLRDGVALVGPRGQNCGEADFSELLAPWPALYVGYRVEIAFVPHPGASPIPICLAFVPPSTPE